MNFHLWVVEDCSNGEHSQQKFTSCRHTVASYFFKSETVDWDIFKQRSGKTVSLNPIGSFLRRAAKTTNNVTLWNLHFAFNLSLLQVSKTSVSLSISISFAMSSLVHSNFNFCVKIIESSYFYFFQKKIRKPDSLLLHILYCWRSDQVSCSRLIVSLRFSTA